MLCLGVYKKCVCRFLGAWICKEKRLQIRSLPKLMIFQISDSVCDFTNLRSLLRRQHTIHWQYNFFAWSMWCWFQSCGLSGGSFVRLSHHDEFIFVLLFRDVQSFLICLSINIRPWMRTSRKYTLPVSRLLSLPILFHFTLLISDAIEFSFVS